MAISEGLFEALAKAKAQPSGAYRAAAAGLGAADSTLGAYQAEKTRQSDETLKKAAVLDNFAKLVDSVGYNKASQIFPFQKLGIDPQAAAKSYGPATLGQTPNTAAGPLSATASSPPPAVASSSASAISPSSAPDLGEQYRSGDIGSNQLDREMKLRSNEMASQQNAPATFDQVNGFFTSAGRPEIGQSLIDSAKRAGKMAVQKDLFDKATGLVGPRSDIAGALNRRTDLAVANAINKNVNALVSGSGALGQSGKNNIKIARIKPLIERQGPLTPPEMERLNADIDGVIAGGVPLKNTEEGQRISTIATEIARVKQQFSNSPQTFNDAAFRTRMVPLINGLIAADNEVQDKAFHMVKANFGELTTPEHLARVREALQNGEQLPIVDVQNGGAPGAEIPGGGTGDAEADAAIMHILGSNAPTQQKQQDISEIRRRTSNGG